MESKGFEGFINIRVIDETLNEGEFYFLKEGSTDPMGNLVKPIPIIGCIEVCQAKVQP